MDTNKLKKALDIGYRILPTCGTCVHRDILTGALGGWGTCKLHTYVHAKHTGKPRHLSIYAGGTCSKHSSDPNVIKALGGFAQLAG